MKEVTLPSGAILKISDSPFEDALALFEVVVEEGKTISFAGKGDAFEFVKSMFCTLLPSKKVKAALKLCLDRALYNGARITSATWEPIEARGDYIQACLEVAEVNLAPFGKSLYAQSATLLSKIQSVLA